MTAKKTIVVVGYPKSGNTWTTGLVAQLLNCPVRGFLDEPENDEIAIEGSERISEYEVLKAHQPWPMLVRSPTPIHKIIYVVRDPRDIAVSGAHYFDFEKFKSFRDKFIDEKFAAMAETVCHGSSYPWCNVSWSQHVSGYLPELRGAFLVRYEDLLNNGKEQLKRMTLFLDVERSDQEIEECLAAQSFDAVRRKAIEQGDLRKQNFLRSGGGHQYLDSLTAEQTKAIELSCARGMQALGYLPAAVERNSSTTDFKASPRSISGVKFLLVRPQGGLNDMLCQLEKCCRYAEQAGRHVIVDTNYKHSNYFNDDFGKYFSSTQRKLFLSLEDAGEDIEAMSVFPGVLSGRVNSYTTDEKVPREPFVDSLSKDEISFDFSKRYPEQLIVHHQLGGGDLSLLSLLRLRLREDIKFELEKRLIEIGGDYMAVHVRHTDYRSDYSKILATLVARAPKRIFVATDNQSVVDTFKDSLKNTRVFTFASSLSEDGDPIHVTSEMGNDEVFVRNRDAILDLLMLAFACDLRLSKVSEWRGQEYLPQSSYSGFSMLAHNLRMSKPVLKHLLSPTRIRFGLD